MRMLTSKEVAEILGIHESTVRLNAKKGTFGFRAVHVGALWKFPADEVYQYAYGDNWRQIVAEQEMAVLNEDKADA